MTSRGATLASIFSLILCACSGRPTSTAPALDEPKDEERSDGGTDANGAGGTRTIDNIASQQEDNTAEVPGDASAPPSSSGGSFGGAMAAVAGADAGGTDNSAECELTPVEGDWAGSFWEDPYVLSIERSAQGLSGTISIGNFTDMEISLSHYSGPITVLEDRGRKLHFTFAMGDEFSSPAYEAELDLTLSPDRQHLAGLFGAGGANTMPAVFVRLPTNPTPAPTNCSSGLPTGDCFLKPLTADVVWDGVRVAELAGGDLLVAWLGARAFQHRIAFSRYDGATNTWAAADFIDTQTMDADLVGLTSNSAGAGAVAWTINSAPGEFWVSHFDAATDEWGDPELAAVANDSPVTFNGLFSDGAGNLTLSWVESTTFTTRWDAATGIWQDSQSVGDPGGRGAEFGSDVAGNLIAIWMDHVSAADFPYELLFSEQESAGQWGEPRLIHSSAEPIDSATIALDSNGRAVAVWEEFLSALMASHRASSSDAWSEPLPIVTEPSSARPSVRFTEAGIATVFFHEGVATFASELDFDASTWSTPRRAQPGEERGESYVSDRASNRSGIETSAPDGSVLPLLPFGTCEGY